jgi:phosphoglycerate dehydrogenase-like enzyme
VREVTRPAIFCTDVVLARYGLQLDELAPGHDVVPLDGDHAVSDTDVARIEVAAFSGDAWPDRATVFMGTCLHAPRLRWLHTFSAGTDHPVFGMFRERGVRVTTSSGAAARPIAATVMMYLLALSRDLPRALRAQARHEWEPRSVAELEGGTVGVVGMGAIGLEVARLAAAFGMRPIGLRRQPRGDEPCETWPSSRLGELAATVDALVVAAPLTDETRGMIDAEVIAAVRPGAYFVNVGRGELVDEPALIEALRDGHLGGAALDVFAVEPLPADSPLWDLPNVIVTPHSSGMTDNTGERAMAMFLANLARYVAGEPLQNVT